MGLKGKNNSSVYLLDVNNSIVKYYGINASGQIVKDVKPISAKPFTDEYYEKLGVALKELSAKYPPVQSSNTTIVLPDNAIFTNCVTFPSLKGKDAKSSFDAYLLNNYKNLKDLRIVPSMVLTNKQFNVVSIVGVSNIHLVNIKQCFANAKITAQNYTFASNALTCGLMDLCPRYRNDTIMLLDIKECEANYIYIYKGRVLAFFYLPIGYNILTTKPAAEDVLLYNQTAELVVVNAKEMAKQKALSMSGVSNVSEATEESGEEKEEEDDIFSGTEDIVPQRPQDTIKTLPKKTARKLPKFMQREVPVDDEGKVYENFRIFVKWGLEMLGNNDKLLSVQKPSKVIVNMPSEFSYLFDLVNAEKENGITFAPTGITNAKEEIKENMELYGALFVKANKQSIVF